MTRVRSTQVSLNLGRAGARLGTLNRRGFCLLGFLQHPVCRVPVRLKVTCQQVGLSKLWLGSFFEVRSRVFPFFWSLPLGEQPDAGQKRHHMKPCSVDELLRWLNHSGLKFTCGTVLNGLGHALFWILGSCW